MALMRGLPGGLSGESGGWLFARYSPLVPGGPQRRAGSVLTPGAGRVAGTSGGTVPSAAVRGAVVTQKAADGRSAVTCRDPRIKSPLYPALRSISLDQRIPRAAG